MNQAENNTKDKSSWVLIRFSTHQNGDLEADKVLLRRSEIRGKKLTSNTWKKATGKGKKGHLLVSLTGEK